MITHWMLYALAVSATAAGTGLLLERALERLGQPTRWVWAGGIALGSLVPARALLSGGAPGAEVVLSGATVPTVADRREAAGEPAPQAGRDPEIAVLAAWLLGSALMAAVLSRSVVAVRRARREWRKAEVEGATVWLSRDLGPAVAGFVRPVVVLPEWVLEWESPRRRLIVRHEMEHVRARDGVLMLFGVLAVCVAPCNPVRRWRAPPWWPRS